MKSLERMMGILDLFEGGSAEWTVDRLRGELGYSRATLYRYLRVLTDAGFLTTLPGIGYTLGPRIIELDFKIRTRDPLIGAARPVMAELAAEISGVALLCRVYRDRVLCVHQESSTDLFRSTYERGKARPLLSGATSRVILAHLPAASITRLFEAAPASFADAGLGDSLDAVRQGLRRIRRAGWDMTVGQVTAGVTGIAAPIFDAGGNVVGSLSLALGDPNLSQDRIGFIADRVRFCARVLTNALVREVAAPRRA